MHKHICILIKVYLVSISEFIKTAFQIKWVCQSSDTISDM